MPYGVKANVKAPHRFMRMGALCWLHLTNNGNGQDKIQIVGLSRGGRKVETWIDSRDLANFRPGWIPEDPHYELRKFPFDTKEEAQEYCDFMNKKYGDQPVRDHAMSFSRCN